MFSFHVVDCDTYHLPLPLFYHQKNVTRYLFPQTQSINSLLSSCVLLSHISFKFLVCVSLHAWVWWIHVHMHVETNHWLMDAFLNGFATIFFETGFLSESEVYLFNLSGCLVSSCVHLSLPSALRTVVTDMCNHEHSILCGTVSVVPTELSP